MIATDIAAHQPFALLAALLDHEVPPWRADELPPLGHWLLFPPDTRQSLLGADGHPARDADGLPRRMWAGSRIRFSAPVALGSHLRRESSVASDVEKYGKSGRMRFVTMLHRIYVGNALAIEEEHDIVYRQAMPPAAFAAPPAPESSAPLLPLPPVTRRFTAGPAALFRYSALTFNAHRIHYDRPYTVETEGYPGLVVHGPLIATLLMDLYLRQNPAAPIAAFSFRAMRPIFDTDPFILGLAPDATGGDLVAIDAAGGIAMQARIDFA